MSTEKITINRKEDFANLMTSKTGMKSSGRVDINNLLARVRVKQQKEKQTNMVFFALFVTLIVVVGILLSL